MHKGEGIEAGIAKKPTRKSVAKWIIGAYNKINKEIGLLAWRKKGFKMMVN